MRVTDPKAIKSFIELSPTVEEADKFITEKCGFKSINEKVAFLRGMFDIEIVGHEHDEPSEMIYFAMLHNIIDI